MILVFFSFYVLLFSFAAVMFLRSLVRRRWDDLSLYFVLMSFSFLGLSSAFASSQISYIRGAYTELIFPSGGVP